MKIHFLLLSPLLVLFPNLLFGQDYLIEVKNYNIEDGLSHRNVNFALQDQRGLMWFGTDYGLNRFDGYNFKWFTKEKHGLQTNIIFGGLEDKDGLLWLFYGKKGDNVNHSLIITGIDVLESVSGEVQTFETFMNAKTDLKAVDFVGFSKNDNGNLVFLSREGKMLIYKGKGAFEKIDLNEKYYKIRGFHWSSNGLFWINAQKETTENSPRYVIAINDKGEESNTFPVETVFNYTTFYEDKNTPNQKWINTIADGENVGLEFSEVNPKGQLISNPDEKKYADLGLDFSSCPWRGFCYSDNSNFAGFILDGDFYLFEKETGSLQKLSEKYEDLKWTTDIFFDNSGEIWAASQFGINQITLRKNKFTKILNEEDGLNGIRAMRLDRHNRLWAIKEGINNLMTIQLGDDSKQVINVEPVNNSIHPNRVHFTEPQLYALEASNNGDIYYQSTHFVATKVNTNNFETSDFAALNEAEWYPWSYFEDSKGKLWGGYSSGTIGLFGSEKSELISLTEDETFHFITYQFIETGDFFWLITDTGLFQFDPTKEETKAHYWSNGQGKFKLPFDNLRHAYLEKDSVTFWLGTGGSGLIKFNIETGEYQQFTKADGLSNNVIYAVYPDDFDNLWLSSDYGIMRFNKTSNQVNTYLANDGISNNEFNRVSHYQTDNGTLFFGTINGITAFHPKDFQTDSSDSRAPLVINHFQQFVGDENKLVDKTKELLSNATISLAPNDPFFRLEFGLLTYDDVDKIQYAYKIEGQDLDWNYQRENYIRLSRLPYGNHELRIKGQASNGQWSPNELSIRISALKPFYLKTWFLILSICAFFAAIFSFNRYRTLQLVRQKRELEEKVKKRTKTISEQAEQLKSLEKLKSRFFANVSHELRTPLTLMLGPINKLEKGDLPKETSNRLIRFVKNNSIHLLKLVNEILDLSKLETNRLEIKETDFNFYDFLLPLVAQFKSSGDSNSLELLFDYQADKALNISLDIGKFEKIVHNFLSNALKFTPLGGTVKLIVEDRNDQLLVKVADSGSGIHPDDLPHIFDRFYQSKQADAPVQGGTGIGLSLCKELAGLLGGRVWAESVLSKGSVFYFEFPKRVASSELRVASSGQGTQIDNQNQNGKFEKEIIQTKSNESLEKINLQPETRNPKLATILIVEDNPELREYLTVLLSDDYTIIAAENGKVAWDLLTVDGGRLTVDGEKNLTDRPPSTVRRPPSLIISDLMMPVMDGFQFLEKVKANDAFRHIPVIMLTARADVRVKLRALRIGVDDYLIKPFVEEELKIRMKNLLENYTARVGAYSTQNDQNGASEKPVMAEADLNWLEEVEKIYLEFIDDSRLNLEFVAGKLFLSTRQYSRKLKQLTGLSPNRYLREIRLTKARDYIEVGKFQTIKETCYAVGFSDVQYFNKIFRERFGMSPSKSFL